MPFRSMKLAPGLTNCWLLRTVLRSLSDTCGDTHTGAHHRNHKAAIWVPANATSIKITHAEQPLPAPLGDGRVTP